MRAGAALNRFAVFAASATLCLILAGALVTSNDAGLSVPDWPLSYGQWMPPMVGGIFYEHGHRMIASFVGFLTIILAVWLWRVEPRLWVRWMGLGAVFAVIAQGVLGGLTVLYFLPAPISVGHACLAQLFFSIMVSIALVTSGPWRGEAVAAELHDAQSPALRLLAVMLNLAVFSQLAMGAAFRHKALGITPHLIGAGVVAFLVVWSLSAVLSRFPQDATLRKWALRLNALVMLQLLAGAAAYWIRIATADAPQPLPPMVWITVLHVALGALVLAASVVFTWEVYRRVAPRESHAVEGNIPAIS